MDEYRSLAIFVAVNEVGSFSGAGRRLKLSTSVVSHHISKLELSVGASLFFRSTRSLSLTPEGKAILPSAQAMVNAADEALDILTTTNSELIGALHVTLPAFGDHNPLQRSILQFAREHPMVAISMYANDKPIDIVKEGFDLAIRLGVLSDSSLMNKRIGSFGRKLVASPSYLAGRSKIRTLEDLKACEFISITMLPDTITLFRKGEEFSFEPQNVRLEVHSLSSAKSAVLEGLGIQHLPHSEVEAELESGVLKEVLPQWSLPELGVYAVWPDIGPQKKLTRHLIDFMENSQRQMQSRSVTGEP